MTASYGPAVALIAAYNESARIARTVSSLVSTGAFDAIIVVDDGSSDATAELARNAGAVVIELGSNRGKGAALNEGVLHVGDATIVALLDADLAESAAEAVSLVGPIREGVADMTIATFPKPAGKAGFGLVMSLARWAITRFGGPFDAKAPLSGQRVMTRACLDGSLPFADGYGVEVALTIRALRNGCRIQEIPTTMFHAATGRDLAGFVHRGRQFIDVLATVLRFALGRDHR